jgi:hypothetical protein
MHLLATVAMQAFGISPEFNPHEIAYRPVSPDCQECHTTSPGQYRQASGLGTQPRWSAYKQDGTTMCVQCHSGETEGHQVDDTAIDFPIPSDLPLTENKTLMCMSCHYMHGSLRSNRPWASVSFMDRLTGSERMNKSYILRRNNSSGELCLICHDTSGEHNRD